MIGIITNMAMIISVLAILFSIVALIGNEKTFKIDCLLIDAIYKYKLDCIANDDYTSINLVNYTDIKDNFDIEILCPWKWNIEKRIDKEKFELLKSYLK